LHNPFEPFLALISLQPSINDYVFLFQEENYFNGMIKPNPSALVWVFSNRVQCTRIHGYTVLLAPIKALPCLCIFPPMAEKSKPPAPRLVGDSGAHLKNNVWHNGGKRF
jgi:hypothetical protein